jgi:hypothetical protein
MALPVNFDPNAAIRIYNAVRKVEAGDRDQKPLTFRRVVESGRSSRTFRLAVFTGEWNRETLRTVSFYNQTSTPNTVMAWNPIFPCINSNNNPGVLIAKDGTSWYVVNAVHGVTAVVTDAELTAHALQFNRSNVQFVQSCLPASSANITLATCATAAASVSSQSLSVFLS